MPYCHVPRQANNNTACYKFGVRDFNAFQITELQLCHTVMFQGSDLCNEYLEDDELAITQVLLEQKGERSGALGAAAVVHLAYFTQRDAALLDWVDLIAQCAAVAVNLTDVLLDE